MLNAQKRLAEEKARQEAELEKMKIANAERAKRE